MQTFHLNETEINTIKKFHSAILALKMENNDQPIVIRFIHQKRYQFTEEQMREIQEAFNSMDAEIKRQNARISELQSNNSKLNSQINDKNDIISKKQTEIIRLNKTMSKKKRQLKR